MKKQNKERLITREFDIGLLGFFKERKKYFTRPLGWCWMNSKAFWADNFVVNTTTIFCWAAHQNKIKLWAEKISIIKIVPDHFSIVDKEINSKIYKHPIKTKLKYISIIKIVPVMYGTEHSYFSIIDKEINSKMHSVIKKKISESCSRYITLFSTGNRTATMQILRSPDRLYKFKNCELNIYQI